MEWQPIETAPKDDEAILITLHNARGEYVGQSVVYWSTYDNEGYADEGHWHCNASKHVSDRVSYTSPLSHWMPLPPPPANHQPRE